MKRCYLYILLYVLINSSVSSQDYHFSQYNAVPTILNPAEVGSFNGGYRGSLLYRGQSKGNVYKTFGFALDATVNKNKKHKNSHLGLGLIAIKDEAGEVKMGTTNLLGTFAYHTKVSNHGYLSFGVESGIYQRSINQDEMVWGHQLESATFGTNTSLSQVGSDFRFSSLDLSAGILYTLYDRLQNAVPSRGNVLGRLKVGLSVHHLAGRKYSFYSNSSEKLEWRYVGYSSTTIPIKGTVVSLQPSAVFQRQGDVYNIIFGTGVRGSFKDQFRLTNVTQGFATDIGVYYRTTGSLIVKGMLELGTLSIGGSYDVPVINGNNLFGGAEIVLRYMSKNPFKGARPSNRNGGQLFRFNTGD